jgi:PAS domain S-box-containing protein
MAADPTQKQAPSDLSGLLVPPSRRNPRDRDRWLRALLQHSHDIILALDAHGGLRFENPAVERLLGPRQRSNQDAYAFDRIHPDDLSRVVESFAKALENPGVPVAVECRVMRADGTYAYLDGIGINLLDDPTVASVVVNVRDTTEQRLTDPLTGLATRVLLCQRLEQLRSQRGSTFALLAVRAERLEQLIAGLNGDQTRELFAAVARRLRTVAGPDDIVARLDNYTFGLLSHGTGGDEGALTVASRVRRAFSAAFQVSGEAVEVEARIGIAVGPSPDAEGEDFIRNAEVALDAGGGAVVEIFDPAFRVRARSRIATEADLRRAIGTDELVAFYQPILRIDSGLIEGFEALVRWRKPDGTLVPPGAFIPVAEDSGLIRKLDLHVLRQACRFVRDLRHHSGKTTLPNAPYVNVNLSAAHFSDTALPNSVRACLDEVGLEAALLKLEVTETALMENAEMAAATMRILASWGIRFGLDDFGTGYSSLSYLHRFPFETLKIDRSFIRALGAEQNRPELAEAIVLLARSMGLVVVAEGVETEAQLEFLRARHCDCAQGFLFSPAVPAEAALRLMALQPFRRGGAPVAEPGSGAP